MNDLSRAIGICLEFAPTDGPTVGGRDLSELVLSFPNELSALLYATDGRRMVRILLGGMETPGKTFKPICISKTESQRLAEQLSSTEIKSVAAWEDDLIVTGNTNTVTVSMSKNDPPAHKYAELFELKEVAPRVTVSSEKLHESITACQEVMPFFKGAGRSFSMRVQSCGDNKKPPLMLITPKILQGMKHMELIEIVLMGMVI